MIVDTHIHLYSEEFDKDRDLIIKQANAIGVKEFYLPAIDSSYHQKMMDLENKYPQQIKTMMGLHPCYVKPKTYKKELDIVHQYLQKKPFIALGEIGIDLYWDQSTLDIQTHAFITQINWAKQYNLPIVIHARNSLKEIFKVLDTLNDDKLFGVFHCFTGTLEEANKAIQLGFKLGIGGVVTFKNGNIDQYLNQIPLKHIVVETDAPYLAPSPFRGKRNKPQYLQEITKKLATIYQKPLLEIHNTTTTNAHSIFKI